MIVVDANELAYLYLPGEHTAAAEALLERDPDWASPILWRSEFRNILAGDLRRKDLSFEQAASLQLEAESLLAGCEFEVESRKVLELVRDSDCSAYDCEFIALAMKLNTKLFTMDKKRLRAFPNHASSISAGERLTSGRGPSGPSRLQRIVGRVLVWAHRRAPAPRLACQNARTTTLPEATR